MTSLVASSSTSLLVSWGPVPVLQRNGPILNYTVYYQRVPGQSRQYGTNFATTSNCIVNSNGYCSLIVTAPSTSVTIPGLEKFLNYSVMITANNSAGESNPSVALYSLTLQDVPTGIVQNISTNATSSTSIVLSWNPPLITDQNGVIIGYSVNWTRVGGGSVSPTGTQFAALASNLLTVGAPGISNSALSSITITGLSYYSCRLLRF